MQHLDYMFCTHIGQGDLFYEILTFVQITVNGVGGGYSMVPPLYKTMSYKLVVLMSQAILSNLHTFISTSFHPRLSEPELSESSIIS